MTFANKSPANDALEVKTRVQIDLSPAHMARLNWLMETCGIETRKDLVNTALTLLEWAVEESVKGRSIASVDNSNHRIIELSMPALSDAARNVAIREAI